LVLNVFNKSRSTSIRAHRMVQPFSTTIDEDNDFDEVESGPCMFTEDLKQKVSELSNASSLKQRLELTVAIRKLINSAPEPQMEFDGLDGNPTSEEPIYLCLNSKIERLNDLHDRVMAYVNEDASLINSEDKSIDTVAAATADDEDDNLSDELATNTPILPRTLTFGYTPFESIAALLNLLEDRYGLGSPSSPPLGAWLDLGSGDGHPTLSAALLRNWKACCGIEVKSSLYEKSLKLKNLYETWQSSIHGEDAYGFNKIITATEAASSEVDSSSGQSPMMFANTDMRSCFYKRNHDGSLKEANVVELQDVSLVFIHATCFDDATMLEVGALTEQVNITYLFKNIKKDV
jgi:hypothetical protein